MGHPTGKNEGSNRGQAVITGAFIALMILMNGTLADGIGDGYALVWIHLSGLLPLVILLAVRKEKLHSSRLLPWYQYAAGAVGVGTVWLSNFCFSRLGVALVLALGFVGQTAAAAVIDHYGWLGMRKVRFDQRKWISLALVLSGVLLMGGKSSAGSGWIIGAVLACLAGATIVIARTLNAGLAARIGNLQGSLFNYLVGLLFSLPFALMLSGPASAASLSSAEGAADTGVPAFLSNVFASLMPLPAWWAWTGGVVGVAVVLLSNRLTPRMPAVVFTLALFFGQLAAGFALDALRDGLPSVMDLCGILLISGGFLISSLAVACPHKERGTVRGASTGEDAAGGGS